MSRGNQGDLTSPELNNRTSGCQSANFAGDNWKKILTQHYQMNHI